MRELIREMPFHKICAFLELEDNDLVAFKQLLDDQAKYSADLEELGRETASAGLHLLMAGGSKEEWQRHQDEAFKNFEGRKKLRWHIGGGDVRVLKEYLGDFRVLEEYAKWINGADPRETTNVEEIMDIVPKKAVLERVINGLYQYRDKTVTYQNLEFEEEWCQDLYDVFEDVGEGEKGQGEEDEEGQEIIEVDDEDVDDIQEVEVEEIPRPATPPPQKRSHKKKTNIVVLKVTPEKLKAVADRLSDVGASTATNPASTTTSASALSAKVC